MPPIRGVVRFEPRKPARISAWLESSGQLRHQREADARHQVLGIARQILLEKIRQSTPEAALEALVARVADREIDPHSAAEELAAAVSE